SMSVLAQQGQAQVVGQRLGEGGLAAGRRPGDQHQGGAVAFIVTALSSETGRMRTRRPRPVPVPRSEFAGFRFPPDVIVLAMRWYLRFSLSYRDVEELLTDRGVEADQG